MHQKSTHRFLPFGFLVKARPRDLQRPSPRAASGGAGQRPAVPHGGGVADGLPGAGDQAPNGKPQGTGVAAVLRVGEG